MHLTLAGQADNHKIATHDLIGREGNRDQPLLMGYSLAPTLENQLGFLAEVPGSFNNVLGSIVADILIGRRLGRATSFSLHKAAYTGFRRYHPLMTYTNIRMGVARLEMQGLIEVERGKSWEHGGRGKQSRMWATDRLLELVDERPEVQRRPAHEVLVMKDEDKVLIDYRETERTIAWRKDIRAQNEALASASIKIEAEDVSWSEDGFVTVPGLPRESRTQRVDITLRPDQIELRRIANNGTWRDGMRFYGHFAQCLPEERRRQLTIGGMPVELLDFGASHPNLLYAQAGRVLDGDAYDVPGLERAEVKLALLILVNAASWRQAGAAMAWKLAEAEAEEEEPAVEQRHRDHARRLLDAVAVRHEPIANAFCTGSGTRLQAIEAEILAGVMRSARKKGIVTVPVHDELIVPANRVGDVHELMVDKWVSACGAFPVL